MTYALSIDQQEAQNARIAEDFSGLPDTTPPWKLKDIAAKAGPWLGLSEGAQLYLLSQLAMIGGPAWTSGTPVAYRSLIRCAIAQQKTERQITRYEHEIIRAGLAFRAVKHGRRRPGDGGNGLNFAPFAAQIDHFAEIAARASQLEKDHQSARAAYRACERRIRSAVEHASALPSLRPLALETEAALEENRIKRFTARLTVAAIEAGFAVIEALRERIESALSAFDKASIADRMSDQSDIPDRHTYITSEPSYPKDTCSTSVNKQSRPNGRGSHSYSARAHARACIENNERVDRTPGQASNIGADPNDRILLVALSIASSDLTEAYQRAPESGWPGLVRAAETRLHILGIHPTAWHEACARMGAATAALCIVAIEAKHRLPVEDNKHVRNPGGCLRALARRAATGALHIERTIFGLAKAHA